MLLALPLTGLKKEKSHLSRIKDNAVLAGVSPPLDPLKDDLQSRPELWLPSVNNNLLIAIPPKIMAATVDSWTTDSNMSFQAEDFAQKLHIHMKQRKEHANQVLAEQNMMLSLLTKTLLHAIKILLKQLSAKDQSQSQLKPTNHPSSNTLEEFSLETVERTSITEFFSLDSALTQPTVTTGRSRTLGVLLGVKKVTFDFAETAKRTRGGFITTTLDNAAL